MSADNQVTVLKFLKADGTRVIRVFVTHLSSEVMDKLKAMSSASDRIRFKEFREDQVAEAFKYAEWLDDNMNTEYGISSSTNHAVSIADLFAEARRNGYRIQSRSYPEMTDEEMRKKEQEWEVEMWDRIYG